MLGLNGLGEAARSTAHPATALQHHAIALATAEATGVRDQQARAHAGLAQAHALLGDPATARTHYEQALALYTELELPDRQEIRDRLATLPDPDLTTCS